MEPAPDDHEALDWLVRVLWDPDGPVRASPGTDPGPGRSALDRFVVLPRAASPRLLVPLRSRREAAGALHRFGAGMALAPRVARRLLAAGMRAGVAQPFLRDRLVVSAPAGVSRAELAGASVTERLREALPRQDLSFAVYVGVPRPNRKPVLQALARDGRVVAYAKVGWNELTEDLVRNEARVLGELAARPAASFAAPAPRYAGTVAGREILAMTPLPPATARAPEVTALPLDATREIAARIEHSESALGASAYAERLRGRLRSARASSTPEVAGRLGAAARPLSDATDTRLGFGAWHGDWAPWNMARADGRLYVWDWERSGGPVPIGFDVVHFHHQVLRRARRSPAPEHVARLRQTARTDLTAAGVPEQDQALVVALYLVELFVRYHEAGRRGPGADELYGSTLDEAVAAAGSRG